MKYIKIFEEFDNNIDDIDGIGRSVEDYGVLMNGDELFDENI